MELFKFSPVSGGTTVFERGEVINGATSKMWVERYRDFGEFEIKAPVSSNLRFTLPIGSFISHVDTTEVMIVENHEINDKSDGSPELTITGRSFETILDQRVVGSNKTWDANGQLVDVYTILAEKVWAQALYLINDHILPTPLLDDNDAFTNVQTGSINVDPTNYPGQVDLPVNRGSLYDRVLEILDIDGLGIKTIRPGPWSPLTTNPLLDLGIFIHKGVDKSKTVTFSYSSGEITNAQYLWSNKRLKTSILVSGKWVETMVHGTETNYNRRVLYVDASEIDDILPDPPTGSIRSAAVALMQTVGRQVLAGKNTVVINKAEISKNFTRYSYRNDYNVGDLVAVEGNYDASTVMRVIEYVEIEDETGEVEYPTLSII